MTPPSNISVPPKTTHFYFFLFSSTTRRHARRTVRAVSAKENAHADQASQEAARPLILPTPRPSFLAPSVAIPVYRKITCQVLRKPLRGSSPEPRRAELPKKDLPRC